MSQSKHDIDFAEDRANAEATSSEPASPWVDPRRGPPVPSPRSPNRAEVEGQLPVTVQSSAKPLSTWVKPLVWLYRLVGRDRRQAKDWEDRIEAIEHAQDIDAEPSTEGKAILGDIHAWRQVKATGLVGTTGGMGMAALWLAWLVPVYAIEFGVGWLAATSLLLPVPLAWRVGRRLWEGAALQGMKELGPNPTSQQQLRTLSSGMLRGMAAGAGMGFTLVFGQALIAGLFLGTPHYPTLIGELMVGLVQGTMGASVGACVGAIFGPLVGRPAPGPQLHRPAGELGPPDSE